MTRTGPAMLAIALLAACGSGADDGLSGDENRRLDAAARKLDEAQAPLEEPIETIVENEAGAAPAE